jgi:hypothetical protein
MHAKIVFGMSEESNWKTGLRIGSDIKMYV